MSIFLKAKKGGSIPAMFFFAIFFSLFSILGTVYVSLGIGNPVIKVTHHLWSNEKFRVNAGNYFVSKALETATGEERKILLKKGVQISETVTSFLANPIFHQEADQISNVVYNYYVSGSTSKRTVDVKPLATLGLLGLESVDPQFSHLKKELDKIKPIKLEPQKSGPNVVNIKSTFTLVTLLLLLLSMVTLFLFSLFAGSLKSLLRKVGVTVFVSGILLLVINIVGAAVVSHQATTASDSLAQEAIPVAAHPLLAPFVTFGVVEVIIGLALFIPSFLKRMNVGSQ